MVWILFQKSLSLIGLFPSSNPIQAFPFPALSPQPRRWRQHVFFPKRWHRPTKPHKPKNEDNTTKFVNLFIVLRFWHLLFYCLYIFNPWKLFYRYCRYLCILSFSSKRDLWLLHMAPATSDFPVVNERIPCLVPVRVILSSRDSPKWLRERALCLWIPKGIPEERFRA
jgi:hypothetical protein